MKLSEYAISINNLLKDHGDKEVYYACDDEGNAYSPVHYSPNLLDHDGKEVVVIN